MLSIGVVKVVEVFFVFDVSKKWNFPWTDDPFSEKFEFSAVVLNLSRESLEIYPGKQQKGEHRSIWLRWLINNCVVRAKTRKNVILLSNLHNDKAIDPDPDLLVIATNQKLLHSVTQLREVKTLLKKCILHSMWIQQMANVWWWWCFSLFAILNIIHKLFTLAMVLSQWREHPF